MKPTHRNTNRELTQRERGFITALMAGAPTPTAAARMAGYRDTKNLPRTAHELLRKPHIRAALAAEMRSRPGYLAREVPRALATVVAATQSRSPSQRLQAARTLLDLALVQTGN